jgi:hypothetical protein
VTLRVLARQARSVAQALERRTAVVIPFSIVEMLMHFVIPIGFQGNVDCGIGGRCGDIEVTDEPRSNFPIPSMLIDSYGRI